MRRRSLILLFTTATAATALVLGPQTSALAVSSSTDACQLISQAKLKSILGLNNIGEVRNIPGHHYPEESDGMVEATCFGVAWSGAKPTSLKQRGEKLAKGTAAEWGWETFAPDSSAPMEDLTKWVGPTTVNGKPDPGGYAHVIDGLEGGGVLELIAGINHLHGLHGNVFFTPKLGAEKHGGAESQIATTGVLSGVRGGGDYWASESSHAAFEVGLAEGAHAAALKKKLEQLGKVAVPAFGL